MKMPSDSLISPYRIVSTPAISISASIEKIGPWIGQTGQNHGGFNSYYWIGIYFSQAEANYFGVKKKSVRKPLLEQPVLEYKKQ